MIRPAVLAGTGVAVASVVALDLVTKAHGRATSADVDDPHLEHEGPRALGAGIIGATSLMAVGALTLGARLGANMPLAIAGAAAFATGGALNGVELLARGSNTNPIEVAGMRGNVADISLVGGVALLGIASLPALARLVRG